MASTISADGDAWFEEFILYEDDSNTFEPSPDTSTISFENSPSITSILSGPSGPARSQNDPESFQSHLDSFTIQPQQLNLVSPSQDQGMQSDCISSQKQSQKAQSSSLHQQKINTLPRPPLKRIAPAPTHDAKKICLGQRSNSDASSSSSGSVIEGSGPPMPPQASLRSNTSLTCHECGHNAKTPSALK